MRAPNVVMRAPNVVVRVPNVDMRVPGPFQSFRNIFLEHFRAYYVYLDMSNNYGEGRRSERERESKSRHALAASHEP